MTKIKHSNILFCSNNQLDIYFLNILLNLKFDVIVNTTSFFAVILIDFRIYLQPKQIETLFINKRTFIILIMNDQIHLTLQIVSQKEL